MAKISRNRDISGFRDTVLALITGYFVTSQPLNRPDFSVFRDMPAAQHKRPTLQQWARHHLFSALGPQFPMVVKPVASHDMSCHLPSVG